MSEGFGRLGFGVPYFKPCYEFFRWWSWLLIGGFEAGDTFLNGSDVPGQVSMPAAHNALVRAFLETTADTLCIIEDDHSADQDVVRRMRQKRENWEFDVVCASYPARRGVAAVVGADFVEVSEEGEALCRLDPLAVTRTGTQQYDCAALGLVLIRRWLLEEMAKQGAAETGWFQINGRNSLDIGFYVQAQALGARVGVDRDNSIVHWGRWGWTMEQFYRWQEQQMVGIVAATVQQTGGGE